MPKIPVYDSPQIAQQVSPGGMLTPSIPQGAFGAAIGEGIQNAAAGFSSIINDQKQIVAEDYVNQLRAPQAQLRSDYFTLQGKDAIVRKDQNGNEVSASQDILDRYDVSAQGILGGIKDMTVRRYVENANARLRMELQGQVDAHRNQQGKIYNENVAKAGITAEVNNINSSAYVAGKLDQPSLKQSLGRIEALTRKNGQENGLPEEAIQNNIMTVKSGVYSSIIKKMAEDNAGAARVYYDSVKDSIIDKEPIEDYLEKNEADQVATTVVDEVVAEMGPKNDAQPWNHDYMLAKLREKLKGKPDALAKAIADLNQRKAARDASIQDRTDMREGELMRIVMDGGGLKQVKTSPYYQEMSKKEQNKLLMDIERYNDSKQKGDPMKAFALWASYSSPESLAQLTEAKIMAQLPVLGMEMAKDLLGKLRAFKAGGEKAVGVMSVNKNVVDTTIDSSPHAGLFNVYGKKKDEQESLYGKVIYNVSRKAEAYKSTTGKDPDRETLSRFTMEELRFVQKPVEGFDAMRGENPVGEKVLLGSITNNESRQFAIISSASPENIAIVKRDLLRRRIPLTRENIAVCLANLKED